MSIEVQLMPAPGKSCPNRYMPAKPQKHKPRKNAQGTSNRLTLRTRKLRNGWSALKNRAEQKKKAGRYMLRMVL